MFARLTGLIVFFLFSGFVGAQPSVPSGLLGIKVGKSCKEQGSAYEDLKSFLVFGSGRHDKLLISQEKHQCRESNPNIDAGYQTEIYSRDINGRTEEIKIFLTPELIVRGIFLNVRWQRFSPTLENSKNAIISRFGNPAVFIKSGPDSRLKLSETDASFSYQAFWGERNHSQPTVDASDDNRSCFVKSLNRMDLNCITKIMVKNNIIKNNVIEQLNGVITEINLHSHGYNGQLNVMYMYSGDKELNEKFRIAMNRETERKKDLSREWDKKRLPDFD